MPFSLVLNGPNPGDGAGALAGQLQNSSPSLTDPWRTKPAPAVWDASANQGGASSSAHFELLRSGERSFTVKGIVSASSPGNVGANAAAALTVRVCVKETAATAFRFSFACSGVTTQTGNSGIGSITGKQPLKTHCQRLDSIDLDKEWNAPDGPSFDVPNHGGACPELSFLFSAGAGFNGVDDNSGSATANGEITLSVESLY